ncbi:hypothetical protein JCM8547_000579 [Rhodosporidiobolus lusitaniae]
MPHTNNKGARDRSANRGSKKPAFLLKKNTNKKTKSSSHPSVKEEAVAAEPLQPAAGGGAGGKKKRGGKKVAAQNKEAAEMAIKGEQEQAVSRMPTKEEDASIGQGRQEQTKLIRAFHAIQKQLASPALTDPGERKRLEEEMEKLGGLEGYQEASKHGGDKSRGGETSKWLVKQIRSLKIGLDDEKKEPPVEPTILEDGTKVWPPRKERRKLRLLDVGAIAGTAYADFTWISTTSIDLNPQAPHVQKCDFFDFPVPQSEDEKYDVVSLSLVMNFVGDLAARGQMLLHAHSYLRPHGYLYLVLPLPCLTNSRYLSPDRLRAILTSTGWDVAQQHDSAKLTYWLLRRNERGPDGRAWKRVQVREGAQRNNFVVVVKGDPELAERMGVTDEPEKEEEKEDVEMKELEEVKEVEKPKEVEAKEVKAKAPAPAKAAPVKTVFEDEPAAEPVEEEEKEEEKPAAPKKEGKNEKRKRLKREAAEAAAAAAAAAAATTEA